MEFYYDPEEDRRERARARQARATLRLRVRALEAYGGQCVCCGDRRFLVLTIDHIEGGGSAHRASLITSGLRRPSSQEFYRFLRDNDYPPGFQILCSNCQMAKAAGQDPCPCAGSPTVEQLVRWLDSDQHTFFGVANPSVSSIRHLAYQMLAHNPARYVQPFWDDLVPRAKQ